MQTITKSIKAVTRTYVNVTLSNSSDHVCAFAFRMGGDMVSAKSKGDRRILSFVFSDYSRAASFQAGLAMISNVISSEIIRS